MTWTAALQPLFLAAVFGWSGVAKLTAGRDLRGRVAGTALHRLLGGLKALAAYVAVGLAELALAAALLVLPARAPSVAAGLLSVGFLAYLAYAVRSAPESSCGCLGGSRAPVSRRGFARAALLLAASVVGATRTAAWWTGPHPAAATTVLLAAEAAAFVAMSAELDRFWLTPLRRLRVRLTHPLAGAPDILPLQATVSLLLRSDAYRQASPLLTSDVRGTWDADDWRIVCSTARVGGRPATAVFAVPLAGDDPERVRVSIVHEEDHEQDHEADMVPAS